MDKDRMASKLESTLMNREYILYEMSRRHASMAEERANPYVSLNNFPASFKLFDLVGSKTLTQLRERLPSTTKGYLPN